MTLGYPYFRKPPYEPIHNAFPCFFGYATLCNYDHMLSDVIREKWVSMMNHMDIHMDIGINYCLDNDAKIDMN